MNKYKEHISFIDIYLQPCSSQDGVTDQLYSFHST